MAVVEAHMYLLHLPMSGFDKIYSLTDKQERSQFLFLKLTLLFLTLKKERKRERGSNLRRQRPASPTAQVLVAQTTRPVQKNRLRGELQSYVRTDLVDWGLEGGRKRGKKQAEEAARTNRRRTKKRMAAERTARRDKYRRWRKRERARAGIEPTAAAPSQPDCPGVSRSDHSAGSKESSRSWFFWTGRVVWATNTWTAGLARRCRRRFDPRSRSFSLSSTSIFSSPSPSSVPG